MSQATLHDLHQMSVEYDTYKADFDIPAGLIRFDEQARMVVSGDVDLFGNGGGMVLPVLPRALGHIAGRLGGPSLGYLKKCNGDNGLLDLRAENINRWLRLYDQEKVWKLRTYQNDVRAVMSEHYRPVGNTEMLRHILDLVPNDFAYKLVRPFVDPDTLYIKMTFADDDSGNYAVGAAFVNGEVGNHQLKVLPFVQRHACTNSIVYTNGGWSHKHYGVTRAWLVGSIKQMIGNVFDLGADLLERVVQAEMEQIPDVAETIKAICKKRGLKPHVQNAAIAGSEYRHTRMGVVNGLSFAAHAAEGLTVSERMDLESLSGAILAEDGDLFAVATRAAKLTIEEG